MSYEEFIARKSAIAKPVGFTPDRRRFPQAMKPFQRDIATWACKRGKAAVFAGTGLGKTLMELSWASQVAHHTEGRVLVFTPLAVAEQTVQEARKFGIADVAYAPDHASSSTQIVVTNYDRRDKFDIGQFAGVVCDESGILKDHASRTRMELTEACSGVSYLLCGSATPAPNDWTELGQHAEFLGVMSAKEMLAMYFVHEGALRADAEEDWRLKGHAAKDFWRWVASWSVMIRHPRDLGYEEDGYDLPPLDMVQITVEGDRKPREGELFAEDAATLREQLQVRKDTIAERVAAAADLVAQEPNEPWLIWCHLNAEAEALTAAIPGSVNVEGSDTIEHKTTNLLGFAKGTPRILVSKPKIAARGMNYQNCARTIFVGMNHSFEELFQAVRRLWRFGQVRPVKAYLIASDLEGAVVANLQAKERKYEAMAEAMAEHMKDLSKKAVRGGRIAVSDYKPNTKMGMPSWM